MKSKLFAFCLVGLAGACDYTPSDESTGKQPPPPEQIYAFSAAESPRFLDANLEATNALRAEFTVTENGVLVPMQSAGAFPESAGADANLQAGVGFGTYANPEYSVDGAWGGLFQSVLTADVILTQPGDAVKFCRSFATTCVTAQMTGDGQGLLLLSLAANVPDTEIGEIAPGVSAAVRGTGKNGLTIAVTDPTVVAVPFTPAANTPFELTWKISRGQIEGSLDYSVAVDGAELASGNTMAAVTGSIGKQGGVAMIFDSAVAPIDGTQVDYSYSYEGDRGRFTEPLGFEVAMSPQVGLGAAPLYVYPTQDPDYALLTLSGSAGTPHGVQAGDAVVGGIIGLPGSEPQTRIYSTEFNGDDFVDTPFEGQVDQASQGGGFYPSPTLCYSQIFPQVEAQVQAGVKAEVARQMYAQIATGIAQADAALAGAPGYTDLSLDDIIAIGTDYATSNVDGVIVTPGSDTYPAVLNQAVSQTFLAQLEAITAQNPDENLVQLREGLKAAPGQKETYEGNLAAILKDKINGTNDSGRNPPDGQPPVLAAACLWGQGPKAEVPAQNAVLNPDADFNNDRLASPAIPAQPAVAPVREQAAAQINQLVVGIYANFIGQAFGPPVPASNFSLSMEVGNTESGTAPAVSSIVISRQ
jgi:hypothetical protein